MGRYDHTFRYIGIAAITLLLFGLAGWYLFISRQTASIEGADAARGFDINVPSFGGSRGSTLENIASGFGARISEENSNVGSKRAPRLWNISTIPVAGFAFVPSGTSSIVRFVERSSGHVFDADPETGRVTRRTNTLMPKIYDAEVRGEVVVERFMEGESAKTFVGAFGTTSQDGFLPLLGINLGETISDIGISSVPDLVFLSRTSAGIHLVRTDLTGANSKELFSLAAGNFKLNLLNDRIVLVERAASNILGSAYEIKNGIATTLARGISGLTLLPHFASSSALLIGSDEGGRLSLALRSSANGSLLDLSLRTTAEKCAWSPPEKGNASSTASTLLAFCAVPQSEPGTNYLNNWYRGTVHTTDSWYRIDGNAGKAEEFFAMNNATNIDVEHPAVDGTGTFIAFLNASDKSLWLLRIPE